MRSAPIASRRREEVVLVVRRHPDVRAELLDRVAAGNALGACAYDFFSFFTSGGTHSLPLSIVATRRFGCRANTPWQISAAIVS